MNKWYKSVSNWVFLIALIILIPVLAINLWIMYQANTDKDNVPNVMGYKPFIVLSGSMETEIHVGDLIITKIVDPKDLKENDVIAFRDAEGTVTTHRIIEIITKNDITYFVTKGDNNASQDQNLVEYKDVEGIYITRIPGIGTIMNELTKPTIIVIVILGVTIIFILLFQISNKKLKREEEQEFLEYKRQKEALLKAKESSSIDIETSSKKTKESVKKQTQKKNNTTRKTSKQGNKPNKSGKHS